jgi:hypothetical protein
VKIGTLPFSPRKPVVSLFSAEEESSTCAVVQELKLAGAEGSGLFMIDRELATRVFVPPPQTGGGAPPAAQGA